MSLALLILHACNNSGTLEIPEDQLDPDDTASESDVDTDTDADADADADADSDADADTDPEGEPDFDIWIGERFIEMGDCEATLTEYGVGLHEDWEYYDYAQYYCEGCDRFYYVEVSPSEVCGVDVSTEVIRGIGFDSNSAQIYSLSQEGVYAMGDSGSFDGWTIEYEYYHESTHSDIYGVVTFPEKE